jgi:outer membrane protein TolC
MSKKIFEILFFCFIFTVSTLYPAEIFTWEKILNETKTKNPTLLKSRQLLEQAQLEYKISYSNFLPKISASAEISRSGSDFLETGTRYSANISGRLSLFNGFGDLAQLKIKQIELKIAQEQFKRTFADVVYNLRKSFINLLWEQKNVELAKNIYSRKKEIYELIKLRYEAGKEDKGTLLKIEADLLNSEFELKKSSRDKIVYLTQLLKDIGIESLDSSKDIIVEGTFDTEIPQSKPNFLDLINDIPEYKIAQLKLQKSYQEIIYSKSLLYPEISLSATLSSSGTEFPSNFQNRSLGLGLAIPIFSGGKNYYNIIISEKNKLVQEQTFNELKLQLLSSLESCYNTLIDDYENVKIREKYLQASQEQIRIVTLKYLNGLVSYYDWYSIENEYINSQKSFLNSQKNVAISLATWKNFLGIGE